MPERYAFIAISSEPFNEEAIKRLREEEDCYHSALTTVSISETANEHYEEKVDNIIVARAVEIDSILKLDDSFIHSGVGGNETSAILDLVRWMFELSPIKDPKNIMKWLKSPSQQ